MKFKEIIQQRYTTKKYDSSKKVSKEQIEELKEILHLSPSSINSQPWRFTFIEDDKARKQFVEASLFNQERIDNASHIVVFSAVDNLDYFESRIADYMTSGGLKFYYKYKKPKGEDGLKAWIRHQLYISLGIFLSACASMEIDSTALGGIDIDKYDKLLNHKNFKPVFAVAIGYRNKKDPNQLQFKPKSRLPFDDIIKTI